MIDRFVPPAASRLVDYVAVMTVKLAPQLEAESDQLSEVKQVRHAGGFRFHGDNGDVFLFLPYMTLMFGGDSEDKRQSKRVYTLWHNESSGGGKALPVRIIDEKTEDMGAHSSPKLNYFCNVAGWVSTCAWGVGGGGDAWPKFAKPASDTLPAHFGKGTPQGGSNSDAC